MRDCAAPQFTCIDTNPPPAPNLDAIQQGLQSWQEWWTAHQNEFQPSVPLPWPQGTAISLATPDFRLQDWEGKTVQLAQFLGKSVLLVFWSPGTPASLDDVPALNALHERNSEHLAILGICIPAAPSCADEHAHGHGDDQEHAQLHHAETSVSPDQFRLLAEKAAERLTTHFPMLADPEGKVGARFCANDLPTYVLIDSHRRIRRRFVGLRSEQALTAILEGASGPAPSTARLSMGDELGMMRNIKKPR